MIPLLTARQTSSFAGIRRFLGKGDIYLNFIGKFDVPAAEEKALHRQAICREAQRRYAARQKQKEQEQDRKN